MSWLQCAGAVLSHIGPKDCGSKLDFGGAAICPVCSSKYWDKALLRCCFSMRPVKDSAVGCLCFVATQHYLKNMFKDRSMSRSWVMINLCCSLLCSSDVLSKGKDSVKGLEGISWKKPKCFLLPIVSHLGSLQMAECGSFLEPRRLQGFTAGIICILSARPGVWFWWDKWLHAMKNFLTSTPQVASSSCSLCLHVGHWVMGDLF